MAWRAEITNGASGTSDIEGKAARARGEEAGKRPSFKLREKSQENCFVFFVSFVVK
jgi:hypothetical protein